MILILICAWLHAGCASMPPAPVCEPSLRPCIAAALRAAICHTSSTILLAIAIAAAAGGPRACTRHLSPMFW